MAELKYVDWDGLVYYDGKIKDYIKTRDAGYVKMGGIVSFDKLPDPSIDNLHHIYKITDKFVSTEGRFDKPGYEYAAGTWVMCDDPENDETYVYIIFDEADLTSRDVVNIATKVVEDAIDDIKIPEVDLSNYYTKDEVDELIPDEILTQADVDDSIDKALEGVATEEQLDLINEDIVELEEAVKNKADKSELANLATKAEVEAVQTVAGQNSVKLFQIDSDLVDINAKLETIPSIDGLATETYVDEKFAEIVVPDVSGLATKEELEDAINNIEHPTVDLSNYYNKSETENLIAEAVKDIEHPTVDLDGYATEQWVNEQGFLKEHQDLSEYAKKSEVPSIEGLATEDFVRTEIAKAELNGGEVTEEELNNLLANYYNKSEVNALIPDTSNFATKDQIPSVEGLASEEFVAAAINAIELPEVPTKVSQLENDANYLTEHQSLEDYAKLTDIPDVSGFATTEALKAVEDKIPTDYLKEVPAEYVTETELEAKGYLTAHQDLSEYAKKSELFSKDYNDLVNTPVIPSIEGLASEQFVKDEIANIDHPTVDLTGYAKESWVNEQGFIKDIPSEYITETELSEKGYITDAALNGYAKLENIPTKTSQLTNDSNFLTEHQDISGKADKSDLEGLATEQFVTDAIKEIEHPTVDLSDYYKKSEVDALIPDVSNFATKDEIPSVEGLATEKFVTDEIAKIPATDLSNYYTKAQTDDAISAAVSGIEIPEVDLEPYATKAQLEAKADNILFTSAKFVNSPIGSFVKDENIQGLTIAQLFTKLLGLTDAPVTPEEPEEPESLIERLIADEVPMYAINEDGILAEVPFKLLDGESAPTESGFYKIEDAEGNIVEGGYQDLQINDDAMYYIIALPKEVDYNTMVELKSWDPDENVWVDSDMYLTSDLDTIAALCNEVGVDISQIDTTKYTIWALEDICTGSILRYTIKEEA